MEVKKQDDEILSAEVGSKDENKNKERVIIELLPAFTINFGKESIFEKSKCEYLIL